MKKRELLPQLHECIIALTDMSGDAAKLELYDQNEASARLKLAVVKFRNGPLKKLQEDIFSVRDEVTKTKKIKKQQLKKQNNGSESKQQQSEQLPGLGESRGWL